MARRKVHQINLKNRYGYGVTVCDRVSAAHTMSCYYPYPVTAVDPGSTTPVTCKDCLNHKLYQTGE